MKIRFAPLGGGFFDADMDAVPREGDTVRVYGDDGPRLAWVSEVVWQTAPQRGLIPVDPSFQPGPFEGGPGMWDGRIDVEVVLTTERPQRRR